MVKYVDKPIKQGLYIITRYEALKQQKLKYITTIISNLGGCS